VSILSGGTLVLRGLRSQIELARKKTSFVAGVSHELKTPLTSIRLYAEMLAEGRQTNKAKQRRYLRTMAAEAKRLTRLVNGVLDFSQLERRKRRYALKELDPERLCRGLLEAEGPRLEKAGFTLGFDAPGGSAPAAVKADEEALRQALLNLLDNSEKYSEERKEIRIELERAHKRVCIRVLDRGRGISASQARHLFKEFYRADDALTSRVKGTGLGLAIARRIVRDHGGEIRYAPRKGGGSVFQLELPAAKGSGHG
jgi:signal transduction histidine kinase